jgi:hypothetical protein
MQGKRGPTDEPLPPGVHAMKRFFSMADVGLNKLESLSLASLKIESEAGVYLSEAPYGGPHLGLLANACLVS